MMAGAAAIGISLLHPLTAAAAELKKQYWATSLTRSVDNGLLQGLYKAVARGEVGWLDVDAAKSIPRLEPGINLVLYHVGGNCYIGEDCDRFPASEPTGDQWSDQERTIDLNDPATRKTVIEDLIALVRKGDDVAPGHAIVGVHLDNVHRLGAQSLADVFNDFLKAVEAARRRGLISGARAVGYVAKNNPEAFKQALERKLLDARPLYQINENARLSQDGTLDRDSRVAQQVGRRYCLPVFLKTFGSDVAYATEQQDGDEVKVYVSKEMTRRMAGMPDISGAAWSADERRYQPTIFVQGSPVPQAPLPSGQCRGE
ncbi:MAG TPA: hypothetical protein VFJ46_21635 [Xanthobacteraceae bacterium]|nr:hypothetical protein [Xanthobacteraceae bacterium]